LECQWETILHRMTPHIAETPTPVAVFPVTPVRITEATVVRSDGAVTSTAPTRGVDSEML